MSFYGYISPHKALNNKKASFLKVCWDIKFLEKLILKTNDKHLDI